MPSNQLAHEIGNSFLNTVTLLVTPQKNASQYTLIELLTILRNRKNPNH
jgi:hypothetical protein